MKLLFKKVNNEGYNEFLEIEGDYQNYEEITIWMEEYCVSLNEREVKELIARLIDWAYCLQKWKERDKA